jgi:integrase
MNIFKRHKKFEEILADYLPRKEIQISRKAYLGYTRTTFLFTEWLKSNGLNDKPMYKITPYNIADFFVHVAAMGYDRPTCAKYFLLLQSIFRFAKKHGQIDDVPFDKELIVFPKKKKDKSAALIPSDIVPVLLADIKENDPQLFLACMLEYYCAVRPGREVRLVKVRNFDFTNGILSIDAEKAKNGKLGRITMSEDLIQICRDYGIEGANPEHYIFGKNKHIDTIPLSENMLRFRFNKYRDKYGLSKDIKLYSWKHMGASYLIHSKVVDIMQLKDHLRHANLAMTQHYVKKVSGDHNQALKAQFPNPLKEAIWGN